MGRESSEGSQARPGLKQRRESSVRPHHTECRDVANSMRARQRQTSDCSNARREPAHRSLVDRGRKVTAAIRRRPTADSLRRRAASVLLEASERRSPSPCSPAVPSQSSRAPSQSSQSSRARGECLHRLSARLRPRLHRASMPGAAQTRVSRARARVLHTTASRARARVLHTTASRARAPASSTACLPPVSAQRYIKRPAAAASLRPAVVMAI
jgi:hypothetical protein